MTLAPHDFAEDHLPKGQPLILTSSVTRFMTFMRLLLSFSDTAQPTMGLVTGRAGVGKTTAIQGVVDKQESLAHTGLPPIVKIKVQPRSTPKALAVDIVQALSERTSGQNIYQIANNAAAAITYNDLKLLIVDEADRLNEDSFDVLRHLHDKTGCPIALVGLPDVWKVISRYEQFSSRVSLKLKFEPPSQDEFLNTILPQMRLACWQYDPTCNQDREMGMLLWRLAGSSLRRLRHLLEVSNKIATFDKAERITVETIRNAQLFVAEMGESHASTTDDSVLSPANTLEGESERRKASKQRKRQ